MVNETPIVEEQEAKAMGWVKLSEIISPHLPMNQSTICNHINRFTAEPGSVRKAFHPFPAPRAKLKGKRGARFFCEKEVVDWYIKFNSKSHLFEKEIATRRRRIAQLTAQIQRLEKMMKLAQELEGGV